MNINQMLRKHLTSTVQLHWFACKIVSQSFDNIHQNERLAIKIHETKNTCHYMTIHAFYAFLVQFYARSRLQQNNSGLHER